MDIIDILGYLAITIVSSLIGILPYITEKFGNLTKQQKSKIFTALFLLFFGSFLIFPIYPLIPPDPNVFMGIILVSILFATYLNYYFSYFLSPTKDDLTILEKYDINIENTDYALIKYFKEIYKYADKGIYWGGLFSIFLLGLNFSILVEVIVFYPDYFLLVDIIFTTALVILSITFNMLNIIRFLYPTQYYVKYVEPFTNKVFEGFKIDRNILYYDGKMITLPPKSKIIDESSLRKYLNKENESILCNQDKLLQILDQLNKIDNFLFLAKYLNDEGNLKKIKKKIAIWLLRRRHEKNKKVWNYGIHKIKADGKYKEILKNCYYSVIRMNKPAEKNLFDLCESKIEKEAPEDE